MDGLRLKKELRLPGVFALSLGPMLAAGVFLLPAMVFELAGPASIPAYLTAGLLMIPALMSKAELATAMPRAGGTYYFLDRSMGPLVGTVAGIGTWFALVFKSAFVLVGMGAYLVLFFHFPVKPLAMVLCLLFAGLSITGLRNVGRLQVLFVTIVLALIAYFLLSVLPQVEGAAYRPFFTGDTPSFLGAVGIIYVAFTGLTKVASVAEEVQDLERTIPLGMVYAMGIATLIFILSMTALVGTLEPAVLIDTLTPMADGAAVVLGPVGEKLLTVAAILAFFSAANAGMAAAARYPLAMSRDRLIPGPFERLGRFDTPVNAILLTAGSMALFILLLSPTGIAKLASAFQLLIFGLVNLAVVIMRESGIESYDPGFRAEPYPWIQLVGILAPVILIPQLGLLPLVASGVLVTLSVLWFAFYGRERVERRGALFHVFERMGRSATPGLDRELRQILKEKGLRKEDTFENSIVRADVLHAREGEEVADLLELAAELLSRKLEVPLQHVLGPLTRAASLGETPIGHHIALPHARLEGVESHEVVIVHAPAGLLIPGAEEQVYAMFVLVGPAQEPKQHLRFLAELANRAEEVDFTGRWRTLSRDEEIRGLFLQHAELMELEVRSPRAAGRCIRDIQSRKRCLIALIHRGDHMIVPQGSTELQPGDRLTLIGEEEALQEMKELLERGT